MPGRRSCEISGPRGRGQGPCSTSPWHPAAAPLGWRSAPSCSCTLCWDAGPPRMVQIGCHGRRTAREREESNGSIPSPVKPGALHHRPISQVGPNQMSTLGPIWVDTLSDTAFLVDPVLGGQPADRLGEQRHVVGGVVGPRVAGPEHRGERFVGLVAPHPQRVEPEAALVGRGGILLVGVRGDQRGVEVDRQPVGPAARGR
jgi:hypothetical protein